MKDEDLDRLIRQLLLDSIEREQEREMEAGAGTEGFEPSARHRRQMQSMLEDPLKWVRRRQQPVWKLLAQRAAAIFLVGSLSFAAVITASSDVRATMFHWIMEQTEDYLIYKYRGEALSDELPKYEVTALPEGYAEYERIEERISCFIDYRSTESDDGVIWFEYVHMQQGTAAFLERDGCTISDITVNGKTGKFVEMDSPEELNDLTWIDPESNIQFTLTSAREKEEMLHIAESVSLVKTTN